MTDQNNTWTVRGGKAFGPAPFGVMGIVNITPDSFYDGGSRPSVEATLEHAHQLWKEGAHILDLGAESSRPGSEPLTPEQELQRLLPVLQPLLCRCQSPSTSPLSDISRDTPQGMSAPLISVDTYHAATARAVMEAGVDIINDISACLFDPELLEVVTNFKPGYVLMHAKGQPKTMQAAPHYDNVVDEVMAFFDQHLHKLTEAGLPETNIVLDPGIGFGKNLEHNVELLRHIEKFDTFVRLISMSLSMHSLFLDL